MLPFGVGVSPVPLPFAAVVIGGIIGLEPRGLGDSDPGVTFGGNLMAGIGATVTRGTSPEPVVVAGGTSIGVGFKDVTCASCISAIESMSSSAGIGMTPE